MNRLFSCIVPKSVKLIPSISAHAVNPSMTRRMWRIMQVTDWGGNAFHGETHFPLPVL